MVPHLKEVREKPYDADALTQLWRHAGTDIMLKGQFALKATSACSTSHSAQYIEQLPILQV